MSKEYIGGKTYAMAEVLDFQAVPAPPLSPVGYARIYFDATAERLRISHTGGVYKTLLDDSNDFKIRAGQKLILDGSED